MNISSASSLPLFVSVCVCVSVTGSAYYLWTSALCAPFSIRHSVIQCGPICCDCRCTSRICGTVSGPEIPFPFPFPHTAEQCQPTHTGTGRAKERASQINCCGIFRLNGSILWALPLSGATIW